MKYAFRGHRPPEIEALLQDVRYGWRMLARKPAFSVLVVLTLGLGVGAVTAAFSIVDAVLLRPLPYRDPGRLVLIWQAKPGHIGSSEAFDSYRDFEQWQRSSESFERLEALTWAVPGTTLIRKGKPQPVLAIPATQGMFSLLGVSALRGRTFSREDLNAGCTAVLSYGFWHDRLGSPPDVPGAILTLDNKPCTAIGVMPKGFDFYPRQTELWTLITPGSNYGRRPLESVVGVFGRLKPGVSRERAQAELAALHRATVEQAGPQSWVAQFVPVVYDLQSEFTYLAGRNLRSALLVLLAAVTLLLLIACVNVANLMLGRAGERAKELAIRAALGSGRRRLAQQLITESLLLSALGTGLGILLAVAGVACFRSAHPVELPPGNTVDVNLRVLIFAAALAILTALLFGLIPAIRASRADVDQVLKRSGRGVARGALSHRAGRLMVVAEAALSLVLLAGAGLLIESIARLGSVSLGFNPDHLLTARVQLPESAFPDARSRADYYGKLIDSLSVLPGVRGAALSSYLPPGGTGNDALAIEGRPAPGSEVGDIAMDVASPDFFGAMGIPLRRGRAFEGRDSRQSAPVAVVNEALVREYFPGQDPLGRHIKAGSAADISANAPWITIVGVVGDTRRTIVYQEMSYVDPPAVYRPASQAAPQSLGIIVRTAGAPLTSRPAVERAVADLNRDVTVWDFRTANDRIAEFLAQPRFRAVLLGAFASLALLLAAIGIHGVLSQAVTERTQEIGIRMALGAESRAVLRLVVGQGLTLTLAGVIVGMAGAWALTRFLASFLYGVRPTDPATFGMVSGALIAVAIFASYLPARRASRVDPMIALRHE
jgi:predicted permease